MSKIRTFKTEFCLSRYSGKGSIVRLGLSLWSYAFRVWLVCGSVWCRRARFAGHCGQDFLLPKKGWGWDERGGQWTGRDRRGSVTRDSRVSGLCPLPTWVHFSVLMGVVQKCCVVKTLSAATRWPARKGGTLTPCYYNYHDEFNR